MWIDNLFKCLWIALKAAFCMVVFWLAWRIEPAVLVVMGIVILILHLGGGFEYDLRQQRAKVAAKRRSRYVDRQTH